MAKSLLLLLCCALLFQALRAQERRTADTALWADAAIPQRLELKKADIGWAYHPAFFVKKSEFMDDDSVRSILYQPMRHDTIELDLPRLKNQPVNIRARVHRSLPVFQEQ